MSIDIQKFLQELKEFWVKNKIPNISRENGVFLCEFLQKNQVKDMLEIGTANGYSTIVFANCIWNWWGKITTIEFAQNAYDMAQENFKNSQLTNITSLFWDALEIVPKLEQNFDFIFIDGMKRLTLDFLKISMKKISKWWTIVIDDVIKFKHKMENLYDFLDIENILYEVVQTDSDDGIMILRF